MLKRPDSRSSTSISSLFGHNIRCREGKEVVPENNSCELYFEESDIEAFVEKLEKLYPDIKYVNQLMNYSWGQKVVRFYDLDGNLIEVRTLMQKNSENNKDENK